VTAPALSAHLRASGLSARGAAALIGYDPRTLRRILSGRRPCPPDLLERIREAQAVRELLRSARCATCGHDLAEPVGHCGDDQHQRGYSLAEARSLLAAWGAQSDRCSPVQA
jgi:hypothetical protein